MRVELQPATAFIRLLERYRPCPKCGSERVTVRDERADAQKILRVACSDCSFQLDAPVD
jgi:predicted RNA-binding Zn-ribbon protein involved in translation (DUF1610 family)